MAGFHLWICSYKKVLLDNGLSVQVICIILTLFCLLISQSLLLYFYVFCLFDYIHFSNKLVVGMPTNWSSSPISFIAVDSFNIFEVRLVDAIYHFHPCPKIVFPLLHHRLYCWISVPIASHSWSSMQIIITEILK